MSITFSIAPTINAGDKITSTQMISLARAFNDRLRSGIGDPTYRIHYLFLNLFRQVRNPAEDGTTFPALAEFFEFYMHLDPALTDATWPVAEPGEPEGANLANPMMAFVLGNQALDSEADRLGADRFPLFLDSPNRPPRTTEEIWRLGKLQRGGYAPDTGATAAPAFTAAQSFYAIVSGPYSPHGKAWGGYVPIPEQIGDCGDNQDSQTSPPTPKYQLFFSPLRTGLPIKYYTGACPASAPNLGGGSGTPIKWISRTPFGYYIFRQDGGLEFLNRKDYIEGPYVGGGIVQHTDGQQLVRALNLFIADWRGNTAQRRAEFDIATFGFDFERFLQSQYFLSPNIARQDGEHIDAEYPAFSFTGSISLAPGAVSRAHNYATGFVLGGCLITATKLQSAVTLEAWSHDSRAGAYGHPATDQLVATFLVVPDSSGNYAEIRIFSDALTPMLYFKLPEGAQFSGQGGAINIECTEQLEYQPEVHDAYLVLRTASTVGESDVADSRGVDSGSAKAVSDSYFASGCIINQQGVAGLTNTTAAVNTNPVYDAARRFVRDHVRIVPRTQFIGYEVAQGKSVLYFNRYAMGLKNQQLDTFINIAPAHDAVSSGNLEREIVYIVRASGSDFIIYNGVSYANGQTFTCLAGLNTYTAQSSEGALVPQVFEYNGIRPVAPASGVTNEWLMFPQFKVYSVGTGDDTGTFKASAFSDYFPLVERCQCYNPRLRPATHPDLNLQFNYGQFPGLAPESPTGWRFVENSNAFTYMDDASRASFYASCRIYEPDAEIESATVQIENGVEVVKLTFKARLHNCPGAPASIARDPAAWDMDALHAEPFRTAENGLREYLRQVADGTNCPKGKLGDQAAEGTLYTDFDNVWGACFPHFFFTHLVPMPYDDGNDDLEPDHDSIVTVDPFIQMEFFLRAMCEGYVDGMTSLAYGCQANGVAQMFDYTFENLCFDAFGDRWFNFLPARLRADKPQGFGPLPNTVMYSDLFNQISRAINKLTRARIMLPMRLRCLSVDYRTTTAIKATWDPNNGCQQNGPNKAIWSGAPPAAHDQIGDSGWGDCAVDNLGRFNIGAQSAAGLDTDNQCDDLQFRVFSERTVMKFQFALADPLAVNALPPALADMVRTGSTGFVGNYTENHTAPVETVVTDISQSQGCCFENQGPCPGFFWDSAGNRGWSFGSNDTTTSFCGFFSSGTLDAGTAPGGDFYVGRSASGANCSNNSSAGKAIIALGANPVAYVEVPLV